jgi:prevent-host-death family protein
MLRAGIAEAKNTLSALLDRVRAGESVIIEDRGVPVARLESVCAPGQRDTAGRVARLVRQGLARPAPGQAQADVLNSPPPKPRGTLTASDALIAERRHGR